MTIEDPAPVPGDPRAAYEAGRERAATVAAAAADGEARRSTARGVLFLAWAAVAWWRHPWTGVEEGVLVALLLPFVVAVVLHRRARRLRAEALRAVAWYDDGLARLDGAWPGTGDAGAEFRDPEHPCADHLGVFGRGSLFERIARCRTATGRATLSGWMRTPADPSTVAARRAAVEELAPALDHRVALAGAGDRAGGASVVDLVQWAEAAPRLQGAGLRIVAVLLPLAAFAAAGWWLLFDGPASPLVGAVVLELLLLQRLGPVLGGVLGRGAASAGDLATLAEVMAVLESRTPQSARLTAVHGALVEGDRPASAATAELVALVRRRDWMNNQVFALVGFLLLWPLQVAVRIEAWRVRRGARVRAWLDAVGEAEALASLAGYAFERPADVFPEFTSDGAPRFVAEGLGHPLLAADRCVRNDLRLDADVRLLLVSGSNMSGKSTLLRSVGAAAVLAQCGAPVCARRLALTPLAAGASVDVHDSLLGGESRFQAEVSRIARVVRMAGREPTLLFLFDELFHGTNSADRRTGAAAVLRTVLERGGLGLVTTHDLELARLAEDLDGVVNVHFEDRVEEGRLAFDYTLRPGIVTRSNALALMRAVGIEVPGDAAGALDDRTDRAG